MEHSDNKEKTEDLELNHSEGIEEKYKDVTVGHIEEDKKFDLKQEIYSWVRSIALVILFSFIFLKVFTNASIPSSSMENTIMTHDRLFGYNFAYLNSEPKRGDIVIFYMPDEPHEIYIKRVIGIENDTVDFQEAVDEEGNSYVQVLLNGEVLEEPYIREPMNEMADLDLHFEVPKDSIFLMGDNRNSSYDGRYWENNFVNKKDIIAKAVFRYWPLGKMGVVK